MKEKAFTTLILILMVFSAYLPPAIRVIAQEDQANRVGVNFETRYEYSTMYNEVDNVQLTARQKHYSSGIHNHEDSTHQIVEDPVLTFTTTHHIRGFDDRGLINSNPFTWALPDFGECHGDGRGVSIDEPATFKPGFDARRVVDLVDFTPPGGTQTVMVEVTLREGRDQLQIWIRPRDDLVIQNITSYLVDPPGVGWIYFSDRRDELCWGISDPTVGMTYTLIVNVDVRLREKVESVSYKPEVRVEARSLVSYGEVFGDRVRRETELGTWEWTAKGEYLWYWEEWIIRSVIFTANRVGVNFETRYEYATMYNEVDNTELTVPWGHAVSGIHNWDDVNAPVENPMLTFTTAQHIRGFDDRSLVSSNPLTWSLPNLNECNGDGRGVSVDESANFRPGFDVNRSVFPTTLAPLGGVQTLTLEVTVREPMNELWIEISAGDISDVIVNINVTSYSINPNVGRIEVSERMDWLRWGIWNPIVNKTYILVATLDVRLKVDLSLLEAKFKPRICVQSIYLIAKGSSIGSEVSRKTELGTWKWTATGEYLWYWEERVIKRVFLEEYPTRQLVDEIATINRRVHEEVYEELQDFLRTLNRLDESGYDISNLQVLTKRLEIIYPFIVQLTSECKVEEAKPLFLQAKGISYQLQSLINFIHTGALLSVVITMLLLCLFSVFLGSFVAKGWLRYLIESLIFFTLALLFLHHQPDLYYSMKYLLPSERLLKIFSDRLGWDMFALAIICIFFLIFRVLFHTVSERASGLASSANMAVQWIKRRRRESLLVLSAVFLIASAVTILTTTTLNYEFSASFVRNVNHSLTGIIVYPRHRFSEIDPWFSSARYVQVASTLFYNPTGIIMGETFFHVYEIYREGERDGRVTLTGVVGLEPASSNHLYNLSGLIVEGRWIKHTQAMEALISHNLAKRLGVKVGESVEIFDTITKTTLAKYSVVGIFDFERAMKVEEINGYPLFGDLEFIDENFIITSIEGCKEPSKGASATRQVSLTILLAEGYDVMDVANVFLSNGYRMWIVNNGLAKRYSGDVIAVTKGLEYHLVVVVMGSLMVLNVMLTSVYQRRKSILIMTCVGLNPSQIRNIFIIESLSLVTVSYLTGYITALLLPSFLKTLPYIGVFFETYSYVKTGPIYPILTISIIIFMALLGGYIPARRAMTITTPSRELRWSFKVEDLEDGSFRAQIPLFLKSDELELFHEFITSRGKIYGDVILVTLKSFEKSGVTYKYFFDSEMLTATEFYSKVRVEFIKKDNTWIPTILSTPSRPLTALYKKATVEIFRKIFLEYSYWKERRAK